MKTLAIGAMVAALAVPALAGCGTGTSSPTATATVTATVTANSVAQSEAPTSPTSAPAATSVSDGTYLVGSDIPAGRYKGTTTSDSGYWQIASDANGANIIANDNVTGQFYVQVKTGQYLELSGVEITKVTAAPAPAAPKSTSISDGTYLVGTDITAGRYKGKTTADSGYWQISSDANGANLIANDNVIGQFYVQVKTGQYLELSGVEITLVEAASTSATVGSGASGRIASTLHAYFAAINTKNFRTAWLQFTPHLEQSISVAHLANTDTTTHDSAIVIHALTVLDSRTVIAYVTFTSTQDASQGPNGDTRDDWTLDYTMRLITGRWLIDGVTAHNGSTHTSA